MKAVVTGATSFIGTALCEYLIRHNYTVYAVVRTNSANISRLRSLDGVRIVYADLSEMESIVGSLDTVDLFFHLAWESTVAAGRNDAGIQAKNINHSLSAIDVAHRLHAQCFVMFGSQAEYGRVDGLMEETTTCNPETEYGKAKLELYRRGAAKCETLGMKYLHLRIFSIYGVNDHPWTLISSLVDNLLQNKDIALSECCQKWNFLYIDDAVRQIITIAEWAVKNNCFSSGIFNIASDDTRVLREFVEETKALIGGPGNLLYGAKKAEMVVSIEPSVKKLREAMGFTTYISFRDGLHAIINNKK